jgi:SAM-dependent methyltransferase
MVKSHPFDEQYFKTAAYAEVSYARYSQYWWSNRFYARLALRHGPQQGRVLEVGCGMGHLLGWLAERYQVFGIDVNEWALRQAYQNVPKGSFALLSAEALTAFPDEAFQIVIAKHVVEHLPEPRRAIAELARVMGQGGLLILATPNLDSLMRPLKKACWVGYKDPTHISLKPPAEWLALLRSCSFQPFKLFSDGFWDAPYLPLVPTKLQKILFGGPGGLQAILGWSIIPVRLGESLIVLARKKIDGRA